MSPKPRQIYFALCAGLMVFLLLGIVLSADAKGLGPVATPTRSGFDIKFASNGQPLANMAPAAGGALAVTGIASIPLSSTIIIEAAATGAITGAASGGAWGAAIGAIGGVALAALPPIYSWMTRAGVKVNPDGSLGQADPTICTVAPCAEYATNPRQDPFGSGSTGFYPSKAAACARAQEMTRAYYADNRWTASVVDDRCQYANQDGVQTSNAFYGRTVAPAEAAFVPATTSQAVTLMGQASPTQAEVQALIDLNFPPAVAPVSVTGPAEVPLFNTVQLGVDGSTVTTQETAQITYFPDSVKVDLKKMFTTATPEKTTTQTELVTTTNSDGTTSTMTVTRTVTTPASTKTTAAVQDKPEMSPQPATPASAATGVCGAPGLPACAIDETGMPGKPEIDAKMRQDEPERVQKDIDDLLKNPIEALPKLPTLNWSFSLPTGCAVIPLPAFEPFIAPIDVCRFQPMFHDIMGVVWMLGGLFGAISLFMKNALAN